MHISNSRGSSCTSPAPFNISHKHYILIGQFLFKTSENMFPFCTNYSKNVHPSVLSTSYLTNVVVLLFLFCTFITWVGYSDATYLLKYCGSCPNPVRLVNHDVNVVQKQIIFLNLFLVLLFAAIFNKTWQMWGKICIFCIPMQGLLQPYNVHWYKASCFAH